jgi:hypothetical protein
MKLQLGFLPNKIIVLVLKRTTNTTVNRWMVAFATFVHSNNLTALARLLLQLLLRSAAGHSILFFRLFRPKRNAENAAVFIAIAMKFGLLIVHYSKM